MLRQRMSPLAHALLAQIFGALIAAAVVQIVYPRLFALPFAAAAVQGLCASFVSYKLEAPKWWLPIHLVFLPALILAARADIAPVWYLTGFLLLLLIFWRTDRGQVPLYFSSSGAAAAVATLLPKHPCHIVDLGCGHGRFLRQLAKARPDCEFYGIEHAPLPWLWARIASTNRANLTIRYGDLWDSRLGLFDVVYAFLSPVPMARLLAKAHGEMRPNTLFISNSFAAYDWEPDNVVDVDDRRRSKLFCYRMPGPT